MDIKQKVSSKDSQGNAAAEYSSFLERSCDWQYGRDASANDISAEAQEEDQAYGVPRETLHFDPLTAAQRNKLKSSSFVFPKDRRYPINDASHARNALARVSQHGSSSEKAKVRAAVHKKYPNIGKS